MEDSGIPGYSLAQIDEFASCDESPVFEACEYDAWATIHEIKGRFVMQWSAMEGSMAGVKVLDSDSIDQAKDAARKKALELASDAGAIFDRCLGLDNIRFEDRSPVPTGARRVSSRLLYDSYSSDDLAEIIIYEFQQREKIVFLVATSDDGLVVGVFDSMEEIDEDIDSPTAFSLEHHD